jgi:S-adenosylmethionine decarboxylase
LKEYLPEGKHCLANLKNCRVDLLEDEQTTFELLDQASVIAGANTMKFSFQKFMPYGSTAVIILSESHISTHSYYDGNEDGIGDLFIDIFTCGNHTNPEDGINFLIKKLKPEKYTIQSIKREL